MAKEGTIRFLVEEREGSVTIKADGADSTRWVTLNIRTYDLVLQGVARDSKRPFRAGPVRLALLKRLGSLWGGDYDFVVEARVYRVARRPCPGCIRYMTQHPEPFRGTKEEAHRGRTCGDVVLEYLDEGAA